MRPGRQQLVELPTPRWTGQQQELARRGQPGQAPQPERRELQQLQALGLVPKLLAPGARQAGMGARPQPRGPEREQLPEREPFRLPPAQVQ